MREVRSADLWRLHFDPDWSRGGSTYNVGRNIPLAPRGTSFFFKCDVYSLACSSRLRQNFSAQEKIIMLEILKKVNHSVVLPIELNSSYCGLLCRG